MVRIHHQSPRLARVASQFGKNLVEHSNAAPAHKSNMDRLVRTVLARSIAPARTVPDDIDDSEAVSMSYCDILRTLCGATIHNMIGQS